MVIQLLLKKFCAGYVCTRDKQKEWYCLQQLRPLSINIQLNMYVNTMTAVVLGITSLCICVLRGAVLRKMRSRTYTICLQFAIFSNINNIHATSNDIIKTLSSPVRQGSCNGLGAVFSRQTGMCMRLVFSTPKWKVGRRDWPWSKWSPCSSVVCGTVTLNMYLVANCHTDAPSHRHSMYTPLLWPHCACAFRPTYVHVTFHIICVTFTLNKMHGAFSGVT